MSTYCTVLRTFPDVRVSERLVSGKARKSVSKSKARAGQKEGEGGSPHVVMSCHAYHNGWYMAALRTADGVP